MDIQKALEALAKHYDEESISWGKVAQDAKSEADKGYWQGYSNASHKTALQIRGLLYELTNPPPDGPWDNGFHMDSELAGWSENHPLAIEDEEGNSHISGVFYH